MKIIFFISIFLFFNSISFSQEFYISKNDIIYSKKELIKEIDNRNKKYKNLKSKFKTHDLICNYKVTDSIRKQDSIIYKFVYTFNHISNKSERIYNLINKKLPEINLKNLDSKKITLSSLTGKPTLINLWFTKCFPCIKEIPLLNILKKKYRNKINFLAITYNSKKEVTNFLKVNKFDFTHLINGRKYISKTLGNIAYPKIMIINKNGIIEYIGDGIPVKNRLKEKDIEYLEVILNKLI